MKIIKKENIRISIMESAGYIEINEITKDKKLVWGMGITIQSHKFNDVELNEWEISHASGRYDNYKDAQKYVKLLNIAIEIAKNKKI